MHAIAHISDPHLDGSTTTRERFLAVVDHLRGSTVPIEAVLLTGDVVQGDATDEYELVRATLADGPPAIVCPGNTDTREAFREVFAPGLPDDAPVDTVLELDALRILLVDTLVPGSIHGELQDTSLRWLTEKLAQRPGVRTLVGWHHPPVALGHPGIDPLGLRNPEGVAGLLRGDDDVLGVLVGHAHAAVATSFAGHPLLVAPGIQSQLVPPFEVTREGPPFMDTTQPPGFALHVVHDDGRLTTYFRILHDLAG